MDEKKLLKVINEVDDKYINEAGNYKDKKLYERWVKGLSIAASMCVILTIGIAVTIMVASEGKDGGAEGQTELAIGESDELRFPEIGLEPDVEEEGFKYYILLDSGEYKLVEEEVVASKNMDVSSVIDKWMKLNGVTGIHMKDVKFKHTDAWEEEVVIDGNSYVEHRVATNVYSVYLEGSEINSELNNELAIGLVNTLISYAEDKTGVEYVKPYFNDVPMVLTDEENEMGYSYISVKLQRDEQEQWAEDFEDMIDISFVVKDEDGNPMKNIVYSLQYISGEKGSYQPGYGITDCTGEFTRKVHPDAVYELHLQKRNQVSYISDIEDVIYEELIVTMDVTEEFTKEIIWKEEDVIKSATRNNPVMIDISEIYEGNCEEVFLQLFTEDGGQIQLGYTDKRGEFMWYDGCSENVYLNVQVIKENGQDSSITYSKLYDVNIKNGRMNIVGEHRENFEILE